MEMMSRKIRVQMEIVAKDMNEGNSWIGGCDRDTVRSDE
jgi:hypothetical protein